MKIRSVITRDVIDLNDEGATQLIAAGIYEAVDEPSPSNRPKKAKAPNSLMTDHAP